MSKKERRVDETVLLEYLFPFAKTEEDLSKMLHVLHSYNRDERQTLLTNASLGRNYGGKKWHFFFSLFYFHLKSFILLPEN